MFREFGVDELEKSSELQLVGTRIVAPDLKVPSVLGLCYALRHTEVQPVGFVWNFSYPYSCAMGLAWQMWPEYICSPYHPEVTRALGLEVADAHGVFLYRGGISNEPSDIADALESKVAIK